MPIAQSRTIQSRNSPTYNLYGQTRHVSKVNVIQQVFKCWLIYKSNLQVVLTFSKFSKEYPYWRKRYLLQIEYFQGFLDFKGKSWRETLTRKVIFLEDLRLTNLFLWSFSDCYFVLKNSPSQSKSFTYHKLRASK